MKEERPNNTKTDTAIRKRLEEVQISISKRESCTNELNKYQIDLRRSGFVKFSSKTNRCFYIFNCDLYFL